MDVIQKAQHPTGGYGFKSTNTGDLSHDNAIRLIKLKEYALSLGLRIVANLDGINVNVLDVKTMQPIAKTIAV